MLETAVLMPTGDWSINHTADVALFYHLLAQQVPLRAEADGREIATLFGKTIEVIRLRVKRKGGMSMLSEKAKRLWQDFCDHGGGRLTEWEILSRTGFSHGSFCAARRELITAGLLRLGKDGKQTVYMLAKEEA